MRLTRYDKKRNKKNLWKLEDKMKRLKYLFTMYGFKTDLVYGFNYNIPKVVFTKTQENIDLFEQLCKELKKKKEHMATMLTAKYYIYSNDKKNNCINSVYYGYEGTYYSCSNWLASDIHRLEGLIYKDKK